LTRFAKAFYHAYSRGALSPTPRPMVTSLHILNFRCFRDVEMHGLKRVNILVGDNGTGKTSLLEALFLAAGASPELALRLRAFRGLVAAPAPVIQSVAPRTFFETLWRDLFYSFEQNTPINIQLVGSVPSHTRMLTISYRTARELVLPLGLGGAEVTESEPTVPLVFEWKDQAGKSDVAEAKMTTGGVQLGTVPNAIMTSFHAASMFEGNPFENANRFSQLSREKKQTPLVGAIRKEFPMIEDISVESDLGVPSLYASVRSLPQKLPLGAVSAGVSRIINVLLAVANCPGGIVMVDEVENGVYFRHFPWVWSMLLDFCREYNAQVFVTSHNQQCISSALQTVKANEDDFALVRSERRNGQATARVMTGHLLASAIQEEIEVR